MEPGLEEIWEGLTVLDLYAGTGALGIEALSRGAAWCDFVESNAAAHRVIERNLKTTGLVARARVLGLSAEKIVDGSGAGSLHAPYGLILADPPYADLGIVDVVEKLPASQLLEVAGLFAVEHSLRVALAAWSSNDNSMSVGLREVRQRQHSDTILSIYRRVSDDHGGVTMPTTAIYPGSFDPITCGHIDIATRASRIFDKVILAVYDTPAKTLVFDTAERVGMAERALADLPNVQVRSFSGLLVDFARENGATVIVRGLRAVSRL